MTTRFRFARVILWPCALLGILPIAGQINAPEVSISGSLSGHIVHQGEPFQFSLTIKNKTDVRTNPKAYLRDLTLQALPAGYALDAEKPVCVLPLVPPQTQSCDTGANFEAHRRLVLAALSPGQSVTVQGYLKPNPDSAHKSAVLSVVVAWTAAESGIGSAQSSNLGENQVLGTWQNVGAWLSDVFKLLAIPAVLALIGYWLNDQNRKRDHAFAEASQRHDDAFATAQMDRQNAQHAHEQEQALRAETWKQMLPLSHNYAAKFYLPLSLAAQNLAKELKYPVAKPRLAFFYLLLCGKKMTATRNEIGGFYFKDLRGERLAASCWEIQRGACLGEADDNFYKAVRAAVDRIDDTLDSFEAFESTFVDSSTQPASFVDVSIANAWGLFERWGAKKDKVEKTAQYLEGFYAVLDYESNRPYEYWYDQKDSPAKLEITEATQNLLAQVLQEAKYTPEQVASYFSAVVRPGN
jgi:hypothetical protein